MSNLGLLRTLRSLLASLYPEETSARRPVADTGLEENGSTATCRCQVRRTALRRAPQ